MRSQDALTEIDDVPLRARIRHARNGNHEPLAQLMREHNQRLFRIARSILRDDSEAEDIVQEVFVRAFTHVGELRDESRIAPWLAKIAVNLSRDRLRQIRRRAMMFEFPGDFEDHTLGSAMQDESGDTPSPERQVAMGDVRRMLEREIDRLPEGFREVFILRVIEQMSVEETAEALELQGATVKTRLHRAKHLLRKGLEPRLTAVSLSAFPFGGARCARTTEAVIARLKAAAHQPVSKSHH